MILFLRLFRAFRDLEAQQAEERRALRNRAEELKDDLESAREECQRLQAENEKLQDRLDAAMEDRKQLWEMTQESNRQMAIAYQSSINVQWQQRGFGAPYPEAPQIPPNAAPQPTKEPIIPRREIPSERVARATARFAEEMVDRLAPKQ